jgi:hypothetical protein
MGDGTPRGKDVYEVEEIVGKTTIKVIPDSLFAFSLLSLPPPPPSLPPLSF